MKVLIIDDETSLLKLIELSFQNSGWKSTTAETGKQGLDLFSRDIFDAVVCDIGLPDIDGIEVLQRLKGIHPQIPVIIITAHGSIESALKAMKAGAYDYVQKPFEPEEVKLAIERACRERKLQDDVTRLRKEVHHQYDFSTILGHSGGMKSVFDKIKKAADTKSTILILGESGTGKELIAKAVHFNSPRKDSPFVVVDCSAIPPNLIESELFGHVKGAFTGADKLKKGLVEEAHEGTLFLDEIGELPLEMQSKLLRLLQENMVKRVGDTKFFPVDIRVIAATNRNLVQEVAAGRFRQDLFYRLNVIPLDLPPLRQRRDDIPLLARHFIQKYAKAYQRMVKQIDPLVLQRLIQFEWPGNVRQLENLIEQMVVMADGETLTEAVLPPLLKSDSQISPPPLDESLWDLKKALDQVQSYTEECMIRRALQKTHHNKTRAAELLGISRRALIYKAQEYKLSEGEAEEGDDASS